VSSTVHEGSIGSPPVRAPGPGDVPAAPPAAQAPGAVVVLVDVRPERLAVMRRLLEASELTSSIGEAASGPAAIEEVRRSGAGIVIMEIQLPVEEGLATIEALRREFPSLGIVVCSFHQQAETKRRAQECGADAYLDKPVDFPALRSLLRLLATSGRGATPDGLPVTAAQLTS
jgi:DNA-binding NarL/FixJ family response regulator